jgi:hypothetical protein
LRFGTTTHKVEDMTSDVAGRMVISCNRCNARLDLGPVQARDPFPRRMPSGWLVTGDNKHLCALGSSTYTTTFVRRYG